MSIIWVSRIISTPSSSSMIFSRTYSPETSIHQVSSCCQVSAFIKLTVGTLGDFRAQDTGVVAREDNALIGGIGIGLAGQVSGVENR